MTGMVLANKGAWKRSAAVVHMQQCDAMARVAPKNGFDEERSKATAELKAELSLR